MQLALKMEKNIEESLTKICINSETQTCPSSSVEYNAKSFTTSANQADVVGTGSYGVVRRCYHDHLKNVAVKCMHCGGSLSSSSASIDEARKQIRFLTQFQHPHIVRTLGITAWAQSFGIIMEDVECGNLRDLMTAYKMIKINWKLRYRILFQLVDALKYLHFNNPKKSYVHLDVKPENILLTLHLSVKLADFGSLQIAIATGATSTTTKTLSSNQYTPLYTAPKRLSDICGTEAKSSMDVYSFAMICYEVITRRAVFHDVRANIYLLIDLIASRGQKPNIKLIEKLEKEMKKQNIANVDLKIFQLLKSVMEKCWCYQAKDRLSMIEVHESLVELADCNNPDELDIDSIVCEITTKLQKQIVSPDKKVSLKHHFQQAILQCSSSIDFTASRENSSTTYHRPKSLSPRGIFWR